MSTKREPIPWRVVSSHVTDVGNMYFSVHGDDGMILSVYVTPDIRWHFIPAGEYRLSSYQYQAVKLIIANYILRKYIKDHNA